MTWQLHYTSVASGPTGRAGFQFVAETPDLPSGMRPRVASLLTYRPPPGAPIAPTPEEMSRFPVALTYDSLDTHRVLTRCVYLGQDYSARYGNFFGHALVVTPGELTGLRPVELWYAPLWETAPALPNTVLPGLTEIVPGDAADPESLGEWLASQGDGGYARLGFLLETVVRILTRGHGRLILIARDVEEIVRWITVISYSLPWAVAMRLSFVTYSADPATASQIIVGTTPDVWLPADLEAEVVVLTDPSAGSGTSRLARTIVGCWRRMDMAGIDGMAELGKAGPEAAAALVAFCRGDTTVTRAEQLNIARLLDEAFPGWVWRDLAQAADRMEYELAAAASTVGPPDTADRCAARCVTLALRDPGLHPLPVTLRAATGQALGPRVRDAIAGALTGLEAATAETGARVLTDDVCDLLVHGDLTRAPRTGVAVVRSLARRGRLERTDATERLVRLAPGPAAEAERDMALREIWAEPPSLAECGLVVERLGTSMRVSPLLAELPGRAFLTGKLLEEETVDLARLVRARVPGPPAKDAETVIIIAEISRAGRPDVLADLLGRMLETGEEVNAELRRAAGKTVVRILDARGPEFRAKVVMTASRRAASWLVEVWLRRRRTREEQVRLVEVAIRLRLGGTVSGPVFDRLDEWARDQVSGRSPFNSMKARFAHDSELLRGYRELVRPRPGSRRPPIWKRG